MPKSSATIRFSLPDFDVSQLQKWDAEREELSAKWHSENEERSRQALEAYKAGKAYEVEPIQRPDFCDGPKRYYALDKDKSYAVIKLDWSFSDHQLRLAFDRLLERNPLKKSGGKKKSTSKVGRGRAGDRLNWLGAKRLYKHCGTYDAAIRYLDSLRITDTAVGVYSDADAMRKAVEKANKCLVDLIRAGRFAAFSVFDRVG